MTPKANLWPSIKLSDLASRIESGKRPKGGVASYSEGIPSLGGEHLDGDGGFKLKKIKYVPLAFAKEMKKGSIKISDILLVKDGATTGKVSYVTNSFPYLEAVINEHLFLIRLPETVNKKWVFFYLWSLQGNKQILEDFKGAAQGGISNKFSDYVKVPLPDLDVQNHFVQEIEGKFSQIESAVNSLELSIKQLELFKQSLLDAEFNKLPQKRKLSSLLLAKLTNGYSGKPVKYQTNTKVLSLSATTTGVFDGSHYKFLDEDGLDARDIWCKQGDIYVQRGNTIEYVGVPAIYTEKDKEFIFPDLMIRIQVNTNEMSTKFLYYAISSPKIRNEMRRNAKGVAGTMPKINQSIVNNLDIPYCTLNDQIKVVSRLEERLSKADAMRETAIKNIEQCKALKHSILKSIFNSSVLN
jgi:type I restriction enzyme, S subunit